MAGWCSRTDRTPDCRRGHACATAASTAAAADAACGSNGTAQQQHGSNTLSCNFQKPEGTCCMHEDSRDGMKDVSAFKRAASDVSSSLWVSRGGQPVTAAVEQTALLLPSAGTVCTEQRTMIFAFCFDTFCLLWGLML